MSKQPTRGHISVKGPTYWSFKAACEEANVTMGCRLGELIVALLDDPKAAQFEVQFIRNEKMAKLEAKRERHRAKNISPSSAKPFVPADQPVSAKEISASMEHTFNIPDLPTSFCSIGINGEPAGTRGTAADLGQYPTPEEAFAMASREPRKPPVDTPKEFRSIFIDQIPPKMDEPISKEVEVEPVEVKVANPELPEFGLFSEEGLEMARVAPKNDSVTPARRDEAVIPNADDLPSLIDTTFGRG